MKATMRWLLLGISMLSAHAAAGGPLLEALDPTFGELGDGRQTVALPDGDAYGSAIALDAQNRILVAGGFSTPQFSQSAVVVRLLADGTPDPTFAANAAPFPADADQVLWSAVASYPDGGAVAVGYYQESGSRWYVCRIDRNGDFVASFGSAQTPGCSTILPAGFLKGAALAVAVQTNGKILVAGHLSDQAALLRLTPSGALDPTFGDTGIASLSDEYQVQPSVFNALDIAPDGSIAAAGYYGPVEVANANRHMLVARFTAEGKPLAAFGGGVRVVEFTHVPEGQRTTEAYDVHVDTHGDVLLTGLTWNGDGGVSLNRPALAKLDASGNGIQTFGQDGLPAGQRIVDTCGAPPCGFDSATSEVLPDGRIMLAGEVRYSDFNIDKIYAMRLSPLGEIDPAFGRNDGVLAPGVALAWWPEGSGFVSSALQGDKMVLAGTAEQNGSTVIAAVRFRNGALFTDGFESD